MQKKTDFYFMAAKKMNKIKIPPDGDGFSVNVNWFRYINNASSPKYNKKAHRHTFCELHVIIKGSCSYLFEDGTSLDVKSGEFLLISKGVSHKELSRSKNLEKFAILFDIINDPVCHDNISIAEILSSRIYEKGEQTENILNFFELAMKEINDSSLFFLQMIRFAVISIIINTIRQLKNTKEKSESTKITVDKDPRAENIEKFISDNISCKLTCEDISYHLGYSARQLNRITKKYYHKSVKQLIDYIKCQYSKKLLLETDMNLSEISEAVGYSNEYNFNRFFKRVEGMPPGVFRL